MVLLKDLLNFCQWDCTHVDMMKYQQLMNEGLVYIKRHPQYPLYLLNYTPRTQYRKKWCKELIHARGLVVAEDGAILARPLPKFFNHYEINHLEELQDNEYEVYEKFDGSLVIMFHYKNKPIFCTRGSFISEQAVKARQIYKEKYNHDLVNKECTYCFEVIYPENKIVVDYKDTEDLFLISITHTTTGKEINIDGAGFKTVNKVDKKQFLSGNEEANMEGYVVKFMNGMKLRVKYKFNAYVEQHKGKNVSIETIKRNMRRMESVNLTNIPDECYDEVKNIQIEMENEVECKRKKIENEYQSIVKKSNNERDVIEAIKQSKFRSILFAIHGNKPYEMLLWKLL